MWGWKEGYRAWPWCPVTPRNWPNENRWTFGRCFFLPFSRRFCFLQIPNCSFLQVMIVFVFPWGLCGCLCRQRWYCTKAESFEVGRFVATTENVKGVPSLSCWWTHLGCDENAGTPPYLNVQQKPLGYHRVFERHLGRKISEIVPLVS